MCSFGGMSLKLCYKLILVDVALTMVIAGLAVLPSKLHFFTKIGLISNALLLCCIKSLKRLTKNCVIVSCLEDLLSDILLYQFTSL